MTTAPDNIAAIYARFSSELQDESTIQSQVVKCRAFAEKQGLSVPDDLVFSDAAASGRTRKRDDYQRMIAMAKEEPQRFSTILVWKFSRLARNREEAIIVKGLLRRHGVTVRSVSEPVDTDSAHGRLMEGVLECLDEFYSANLAAETRRGQEQANAGGFWTGGRPPYGYKLKKIPDPAGRTGKGGTPLKRTVLEVDPLRARVVNNIFLWSSQGLGMRKIAARLNDAAVPTPDNGKGFDPSTIRGILHNETYLGRLIYNRQQFFRKPDGGKTKRMNPRSEWKIHERPELRIIDDDLWERVRARFDQRKKNKRSVTAHTMMRYPFTGMITCVECGASLTANTTTRKGHRYTKYRCGYNRRRGASVCANDTKVDQDELLDFVVNAIEEHVLKEANVKIIVEAVEKLILEARGNHSEERKRLEKERAMLDEQIGKLTQAISVAGEVTELAKQVQEKSRRRTNVDEALKSLNVLVRDHLLDGLEEKVRSELQDIRGLLKSADPTALRSELQRHIASITVDQQGQISIEGSLAGALDAVLKLVAGARYALEHRLAVRWAATWRAAS